MFFRIVNSTILFSDEFQPYFDNTIENIGGTSDITDDEWALLISQPSVDSADMLEVAGANRSTECGSDEPCTSHIGITKTEKRKITTESMESQTAMSNKKKKKDDLVPLDYDNVEPDQWVMVIYKDQKYLGQCVEKEEGQFKVKCLTEPYPTGSVQEFEGHRDIIFYEVVYKPPVIPNRPLKDDTGKNSIRKTMYKYDTWFIFGLVEL